MSRPLCLVVLSYAAGLLAGLAWPPQALPTLTLLTGSAAVVGLPVFRRHRFLILFGLAGLVLGRVAAGNARRDCLNLLPDGASIEARGYLTALPDDRGVVRLKLTRVRFAGETCACHDGVRAYGREREWRGDVGGTEVVAWGRWLANPVQGPWPRSGERAGSLVVDSTRHVAGASAMRHPGAMLRGRVQRKIRTLFRRRAGLVEALVLARRGGVDPATRERFARAGLSHLLAISGLHVGIIAGVLMLLGRLIRISARASALVAVTGTFAYVLFLGAPHAAARAALQIGLWVLARLLQRPSDRFTPLAAAALLLLLADPLAILDPGFQLSFAGTAGIVALRRRLLTALPFGRLRVLQDSMATSIAATVATAPIAALHFGRVAPIGIVANLAAIPAIAAAVPALALSLAVGGVWPAAGQFLAGGAELLLDVVAWIAERAAAVPAGSQWVPRDAVFAWFLAALASAVVAARLARTAPPPVRATGVAAGDGGLSRGIRPVLRRLVAVAVALAVLTAWPAAAWYGRAGSLDIYAIDVGQGDALAIRSPVGRWILVDTGPRTRSFDAGKSRVVPFLLRHGVRRLEAMVLTHPDADHIGGAPAVLDAIEVRTIVDPGLAAGKSLYVDILTDARQAGSRWIAARTGRVIHLDGMTLRFLYPAESSLDANVGANQVSVAFQLEFGNFHALFLGDVPAEVEQRLVAREGASLRSELLKVAHHGSGTSTSEALLTAAAPRLALISVGRRNRYGHPDPHVLRRLARQGIQVLRTDRDGSIRVRVALDGRIHIATDR